MIRIMARPLSEDKRDAILTSAAELVAVMGTSAPTSKIARGAGVAEGTLFTYFTDKDALLSALFLELEQELASALLSNVSPALPARAKIHMMWNGLIDWSAANPQRNKALRQLKVSERIDAQCRRSGEAMFGDFRRVLADSLGEESKSPAVDYAAAVLTALADTTLGFIAREPKRHNHYRDRGFDSFWKAVAS